MSLRTRVLAGVSLVGIVLILVLALITRSTRANLLAQVDEQLIAANGPARSIGSGFPGRPPEDLDPSQGDAEESPGRFSSLYVGEVDNATVVTLISPNLIGDDVAPPRIDATQAVAAARDSEPFTVDSTDGSIRYRVRASIDPLDGVVRVVALPIDSVDDAITGLLAVEVLGAIVILAVLALVAWWVIRLGIRPIKQMTSAAASIAAGDLSERVPEAPQGTEAGQLGDALNTMLERIETAFDEKVATEERLRRFVADASHELRTPVATIRGYAELFRTGGLEEVSSLQDAMRRTEQEATRMGGLVDDLLQLARMDEGRPIARDPVDLCAIARDAAGDALAVDPDRPVRVDADASVMVSGDEARLRQVLANVLGNAMVHTPAGTPVEIEVSGGTDAAVLSVRDHGPGMNEEVAARALERFYRADPARSRDRGGSGLGLAIVDAIVQAHQGSTAIESLPGEGTTVRIELPLFEETEQNSQRQPAAN